MSLKDSEYSYGPVTKFLHWSIALLIVFQVFIVYYKRYVLSEGSELGKFFIGGLHKPIGVALHTLAALEHHFVQKDNMLTRMLPFGK